MPREGQERKRRIIHRFRRFPGSRQRRREAPGAPPIRRAER
jgi:hypothetical protein